MEHNSEKTIFITGCSSGIGLCALHYLKEVLGFRVIAACRKLEDVTALHAAGFEALSLDLDDSESINAACLEVGFRTQGRLYGLFNNAGYGVYGPLESISRATLEAQFSANFFGLHELTMGLLPLLKASTNARIVQTSSVLGFISTAGRGAYASSKHALEAWSDALRLELSNTAIQVSLIEPGPIKTAFSANVDQAQSTSKVTNPKIAAYFTLTPEAVMPKLKHAFTSKRAKIRYRVTLVSQFMWYAKRLLPNRLLDCLLFKK